MRFVMVRRFLTSLVILLLIVLLSGCLAGRGDNTSRPVALDAGLPFATRPMSATLYQQEIKRWQAVLHNNAESHEKAEAHVHLATLYLAKDNPQKNYHNGYVELTKATQLWPDLKKNRALASWLELLTLLEIERQQAREEKRDYENKVARVEQQNASQRQEIVSLRETIDKLNRLELSLERKRRAFK